MALMERSLLRTPAPAGVPPAACAARGPSPPYNVPAWQLRSREGPLVQTSPVRVDLVKWHFSGVGGEARALLGIQ